MLISTCLHPSLWKGLQSPPLQSLQFQSPDIHESLNARKPGPNKLSQSLTGLLGTHVLPFIKPFQAQPGMSLLSEGLDSLSLSKKRSIITLTEPQTLKLSQTLLQACLSLALCPHWHEASRSWTIYTTSMGLGFQNHNNTDGLLGPNPMMVVYMDHRG